MTPPQPPLVDLLGAHWDLGSAVLGLAWNGRCAAFALADGTAALATVPWAGAPALRPRPGGGAEVVPGGAPPPLARAAVSRGPCLAVAPGGDGFLTGGADGRLRRLSLDGAAEKVAQLGGPVEAVVATGAGWACIAGGAVHEGPDRRYALPGAKALAWHDQAGLAVSHAGGVALCQAGRVEHLPGEAPGGAVPAFSPDGRWLAAGAALWRLDPPARTALPGASMGPARSAFSGDGGLLAVGGAEGVQVWRLAEAVTLSGRRGGGRAVAALAWHPRRALLAVAHENGAVALGSPGDQGTLLLRGASGEGVSAVAFEANGARLAIGAAEGACEVIALPDLLFRGGEARAGTDSEGVVA